MHSKILSQVTLLHLQLTRRPTAVTDHKLSGLWKYCT